jgi:hypothetical protein
MSGFDGWQSRMALNLRFLVSAERLLPHLIKRVEQSRPELNMPFGHTEELRNDKIPFVVAAASDDGFANFPGPNARHHPFTDKRDHRSHCRRFLRRPPGEDERDRVL